MYIRKNKDTATFLVGNRDVINFVKLTNPMFGNVSLVSLEGNKRRNIVVVSSDGSFMNGIMKSDITPKITSEIVSIFALGK